MNDLHKIFLSELTDILDAENQLVDALPEMAEAARSQELRNAFNHHLEQTRNHVLRLEKVFEYIQETPRRKTCKGMEGLIDEGELLSTEFGENVGLDAALICAAQKVEHYEIASYGSLCTWAEALDFTEALPLLKETLGEEKEADEALTQLAIESCNMEATLSDTPKKSETVSQIRKVVSSGT